MLTVEGGALILRLLAGASQDSLIDGTLIVSNGQESAAASPDSGFPKIEGDELIFEATFAENQANFEWSERRVVTAQGVVVDIHQDDMGRKVPGQVSTLRAAINLVIDG